MVGTYSRITVILGTAVAVWGCGAGVRDRSETSSPDVVHAEDSDETSGKGTTAKLQDATPETLYQAAIQDAAVASTDEVFPLKAPTGDRVTVLTWVSDKYLSSYPVGSRTTLSWGNVWVTLVPEVQEKCRQYSDVDLRLRLQQLLGLPPKEESRTFVVMEAKVGDLFRPCIEPDVHAAKCTVTGSTTDAAHALFYANQTAISYTTPGGYPWTRLGYTFDWNPDTSEYGASEYVLREGAVVTVKSLVSTAEYCR